MAAPITTSAGRVLTEAEAEIEARVQADADQWAHDVLDTADMLGNTMTQARDVHRSGLGVGQLWERLAEHSTKENAPDPLQRDEGDVSETKHVEESKVQTMTNPSLPQSTDKPKIIAKDRDTAKRLVILNPIGSWAADHDIERIADTVLSWDEDQQGYYQNCTVEEFWTVVEANRIDGSK